MRETKERTRSCVAPRFRKVVRAAFLCSARPFSCYCRPAVRQLLPDPLLSASPVDRPSRSNQVLALELLLSSSWYREPLATHLCRCCLPVSSGPHPCSGAKHCACPEDR